MSPCCGTVPYSINTFGVIAGQYEDASLVYHGFVRGPLGQGYETVDDPLAGKAANQGTQITSINDWGAVAGYYADSVGNFTNPNAPYHVFARVRGRYQTIDPPGAVQAQACLETCINGQGTVTGFYFDAGGNAHGFVWSGGPAATPIDVKGALGTIAASINNHGDIAGYFFDGTGDHGFIRSPGGSITTFNVDAPTATGGTVAFSINDRGEVGGSYLDAAGAFHGFVRDSKGKFTYFDAPDAGTGQFQGTRVSVNGPSGAVTGWVTTNGNTNRGFAWYRPEFAWEL